MKNTALVTSTDNKNYPENWHFNTNVYIDFGKLFSNENVIGYLLNRKKGS